ncbi:type II secretion system protein [Geobacter grbiciae]|uniref:type II secretion system protein n=1 Tax=Geobacter grbiciae TaxID=155042 RepID=UPI001C02640B|nr:type II secretion system protein [Geobacter grbiciae]MBT1075366.1 type II secretion system GspH family protein [Geobacter grbiciae]
MELPRSSLLTSSAGFTYIAALMVIVIMGIMLGITGQTWRTKMKRERETELLFRGVQYQRAIRRWHQYDVTEGKPLKTTTQAARPLNDLKDLLKDPGSLSKERYLRRLFTDPFTDKEFEVVRNPQKGIIGVRVTEEDEPFKQGNFDKELEGLDQKKKYNEWVFGLPEAVTPTAGKVTQGSPASAGAGTSSVP